MARHDALDAGPQTPRQIKRQPRVQYIIRERSLSKLISVLNCSAHSSDDVASFSKRIVSEFSLLLMARLTSAHLIPTLIVSSERRSLLIAERLPSSSLREQARRRIRVRTG